MHFFILLPPLAYKTISPAPPVGLAYLAAQLKSLGIQVTVLSADAEGQDVNRVIKTVIEAQPDILGMSVATPAFNNSVRILKDVKAALKSVATIAGGPHATLFPEEFLKNGMDFVIRGEGEVTLLDLMAYFKNGKVLPAIDGISYLQDKRPVHNAERALIDDLNSLPFPAWEFFPIHHYESSFKRRSFSLPIVSSRGCPGRCTFCYKDIFGTRFRVRSAENIVDEVAYLKKNFGIEEFSIVDDSFTSIPERVMNFCRLLEKEQLNLPWSLPAGIRVDTASEELLRSLKESGCYRIGFGVETGNAHIMKTIKKGVTLDQIRKSIRSAKEVGLERSGYFMIGNPEETIDTINDTIAFALELDPEYAQFTRATPYPGSEMYQTLLKENRIVSQNWDDYDSFLTDRELFRHKNLSSQQIKQKLSEAYRRFYLRPGLILRELRKRCTLSGLRKLLKSMPFIWKQIIH